MEKEIEVTEVDNESICEEAVERDLLALEKKLLERSKSEILLEAILEWLLVHFFFATDGVKCACGKHSTKECLVLRNRITGKTLIASYGCVLRLHRPVLLIEKKLFSAIKRILTKKGDAHASSALVQFAFKTGRINQEIKDRYLNLVTGHGGRTKFVLSHDHYNETAFEERRELNRLIILGLNHNLPRCKCKRLARAQAPYVGTWSYDEEDQEYSFYCSKCNYARSIICSF